MIWWYQACWKHDHFHVWNRSAVTDDSPEGSSPKWMCFKYENSSSQKKPTQPSGNTELAFFVGWAVCSSPPLSPARVFFKYATVEWERGKITGKNVNHITLKNMMLTALQKIYAYIYSSDDDAGATRKANARISNSKMACFTSITTLEMCTIYNEPWSRWDDAPIQNVYFFLSFFSRKKNINFLFFERTMMIMTMASWVICSMIL